MHQDGRVDSWTLSRRDYEREFGPDDKKPAWFDRVLAFIFRLLPKVGPLKPLKFEAPTPSGCSWPA